MMLAFNYDPRAVYMILEFSNMSIGAKLMVNLHNFVIQDTLYNSLNSFIPLVEGIGLFTYA